jgi:hypothetical protein|tara:strand:+ start:508 stop:660 length:153 start_codon:yes stop_codon:yes gene_type:complete
MYQLELFSEDDRPERNSGWIINPSAPATQEELNAFFQEMRELLNSTEDAA